MVAVFPTVKLADCVDLLAGFAFKSQHFTDRPDDIPLVKGENVSQGCILWEISKRWSAADWASLEKYQLRAGDVVVAMDRPWVPAGLKWAYIRSDDPKTLLVQRCSRLRSNTPKLDQDFLRFVIGGPGFESYVIPITTGVNVPHISGKQILDYEFALPPLPIQQRIAGILSAYDELIENSQRRIKILEAMARALYHEWFVHFRFPGHENHPRVASPLGEIPQGWEVKRLDEVCRSIQDGDWIETKDQGGEDYRLLQISNVGVGKFIETGNFRYVTQETFERLRCNEIVPGDLLVARMPTPIGRGWLVTKMPWRMITAVDVAIIRAEPTVIHPLFLVKAWNEFSNLQRIAAQASGTTRLRITRRELAAMEFVIPPIAVQQQFAEVVQSQSAMIDALRQQIQNLRSTRDLLLPRLLSGQIEVEVA
jgi:type I restriction enzyme S subunit